jgi:hypothetical protein
MNLDAILAAGRPTGGVFQSFEDQDSGCRSYGVEEAGQRVFLKLGPPEQLRRAAEFHLNVQHEAIVAPLAFAERAELAVLAYPWCPGEVLYHPVASRRVARTDPASPMYRFRAQPEQVVRRAIRTILAAHTAVIEGGYVAVDFYDGAMLWDPETATMRLIDLDEYQPVNSTVGTFPMTGSRRYLAPEEQVPGAILDERTTVYTMGRTARILLDAGDNEDAWRGTAAQFLIVTRATEPDPADRYQRLWDFSDAWRSAWG